MVENTKKYNVGFVLGVFDLFHIGHINLIRRAKEHCNRLMVGVVADELPFEIKGVFPVIAFENRFEIIKAVRGVDEVVKVDFSNVGRVRLWEQYKYDCFFCGDDYADKDAPLEDRRELRKKGSDLMFLPYTKGRTSTEIRNALKQIQLQMPASARNAAISEKTGREGGVRYEGT